MNEPFDKNHSFSKAGTLTMVLREEITQAIQLAIELQDQLDGVDDEMLSGAWDLRAKLQQAREEVSLLMEYELRELPF